ncbi:hypothetical protein Leryth_026855 [Lithospermum erythrorhizon]|nr:hypothetical protein Leryth_026855 [Lithospermum erythrorhizon]
MSRRVRRKFARRIEGKVDFADIDEAVIIDNGCVVDWTKLPDDTVIQLFGSLNYRDRASLASTCRTWRILGASPCLWQSLDLRPHKCDLEGAAFLAVDITDATLSVIVARHDALESLQLGPDFCERITSDAIRAIAICCPQLRKLHLSGIREVDSIAINSLAQHCRNLTDIAFLDCLSVDESALGFVGSVHFLSVAGSTGLKWGLVSECWSRLPNLIGLDVSRTDITPSAVSRLFSSLRSLKILCALNCSSLEEDASFVSNTNHKDKILLSFFTDISKEVSSIFVEVTKNDSNAFINWRNSINKDRKVDEIMFWLEWILCHSLLRIAESTPQGSDKFWVTQGAPLLLTLMQSTQEEVQERSATGLATFVVIDDENASIDGPRAEKVMKEGGIHLLLELARSYREGLQSEAAKALANLSVNTNVAKAVAEVGGINILTTLARSKNKLVAEEAAGGLWNLSVGEEHKGAIAEAGGIKALVDLIFKWPVGGEGVLERAAGALANLAADDKCSMEVASASGVHALVNLARNCKAEGVQEQAARALANLAAHGDSNTNNSSVGQEPGALEALVQLTHSSHDGVRQEAAGALWNLSFDDGNREAIATAGGVEALVALAHSCANATPGLQERAAGALWGLSVSEANSIAIGQEGGVAPLIALARSTIEDVHETAAGALWNLAFNPGNALRIVEEGGVPVLVHLCSLSASKMARFMAALALAYMFDGRVDEVAIAAHPFGGNSKSVSLDAPRRLALKQIDAFVLSFSDRQAFASANVSVNPAGLIQTSTCLNGQQDGAEIGRFVTMLRNPSSVLKACAAFALLQFTVPGGRHAFHHVSLLQSAGASRILRATAASANAPLGAKIFARIVLRNLEHHQLEFSV